MFTLYGSAGSGSAAIECALEACKLSYQVVRASSWEADSRFDELLGLNPLGQVPVLVLPDGTVLSESAAILIHLGLTYPAGRLLPATDSERATVLRGLQFVASQCYACIGIIDHPERWTTTRSATARAAVQSAARANLHRAWEVFADSFAGLPYFNGRQPGALDFLVAVVSHWAGARAHLAANRPACHATIRRIESHRLVARVFARHWP